MADPKFKSKVRRAVQLAIREMRDGCLECRAQRGLCHRHWPAAVELVLNPKKFLRAKP